MGAFRTLFGTYQPDPSSAREKMDEAAYDSGLRAQEKAQRRAQEQYLAHIGGLGSASTPKMPPNPPAHPTRNDTFEPHPVSMISMRLHLKSGDRFPLPHIDAYVFNGVAIVFCITKDNKPVVIEDDPNLFPSDTLITQLRLLIG